MLIASSLSEPTTNKPFWGTRFANKRNARSTSENVAIDIGVVELHVADNRDLGKVMKKLGPLVEVCGVVLVAFDDERVF